jgi:D-alanyl-D-alanine carboxypeptidase/D-alanyl-D-alanine-endopeptidase (penicillin-binding protein 4)
MLRTLLVLFGCFTLVAAPKGRLARVRGSLAKRIETTIRQSPSLSRAHVGILVIDSRGRVKYGRNANSWFIPASNTKLYSTALALTRLGPGYQMTTRVTSGTAPDASGVIYGDLRLVGGGDPSLSSRSYPYRKEDQRPEGIPGIEELADQVAARGVKRITGAVIGDDTTYLWDPFPAGWSIDDPTYEYGAPVSALTVQDNSIRVEIRPGEAAGDPVTVSLTPELGQLTIIPAASTLGAGERSQIRIERAANTRELRIEGGLAAGAAPVTRLVAIEDPALYAARALHDALARRGIVVQEPAAAKHRLTTLEESDPGLPVVLAERKSPPLAELVKVVNKVSQNLHAELLLREVSRQGRSFGSREAGIEELRAFLRTQVALKEDDVQFVDGSGLSRLTLLTPEATAKLLRFMAESPARDAWMASLPIGGEDGTLARRLSGVEHPRRVRAKTGTLTHVSALGGYLDHRKHGRLTFTILVNNFNLPGSDTTKDIDKIVGQILE